MEHTEVQPGSTGTPFPVNPAVDDLVTQFIQGGQDRAEMQRVMAGTDLHTVERQLVIAEVMAARDHSDGQ